MLYGDLIKAHIEIARKIRKTDSAKFEQHITSATYWCDQQSKLDHEDNTFKITEVKNDTVG